VLGEALKSDARADLAAVLHVNDIRVLLLHVLHSVRKVAQCLGPHDSRLV
jgi:hypothetical protein